MADRGIVAMAILVMTMGLCSVCFAQVEAAGPAAPGWLGARSNAQTQPANQSAQPLGLHGQQTQTNPQAAAGGGLWEPQTYSFGAGPTSQPASAGQPSTTGTTSRTTPWLQPWGAFGSSQGAAGRPALQGGQSGQSQPAAQSTPAAAFTVPLNIQPLTRSTYPTLAAPGATSPTAPQTGPGSPYGAAPAIDAGNLSLFTFSQGDGDLSGQFTPTLAPNPLLGRQFGAAPAGTQQQPTAMGSFRTTTPLLSAPTAWGTPQPATTPRSLTSPTSPTYGLRQAAQQSALQNLTPWASAGWQPARQTAFPAPAPGVGLQPNPWISLTEQPGTGTTGWGAPQLATGLQTQPAGWQQQTGTAGTPSGAATPAAPGAAQGATSGLQPAPTAPQTGMQWQTLPPASQTTPQGQRGQQDQQATGLQPNPWVPVGGAQATPAAQPRMLTPLGGPQPTTEQPATQAPRQPATGLWPSVTGSGDTGLQLQLNPWVSGQQQPATQQQQGQYAQPSLGPWRQQQATPAAGQGPPFGAAGTQQQTPGSLLSPRPWIPLGTGLGGPQNPPAQQQSGQVPAAQSPAAARPLQQPNQQMWGVPTAPAAGQTNTRGRLQLNPWQQTTPGAPQPDAWWKAGTVPTTGSQGAKQSQQQPLAGGR